MVKGSDLKSSKITQRLETLGATVFEGQRAENLENAEVVVISSAIKPGNAELDEARARGLPVVRRAEMLAELMRLKSNIAIGGTHGKTTTTTMMAELMVAGGFDPTVVNGGIIHAYGSNARMGQGEWMVVEADESDGSFLRLDGTIAVVTNIDPEHLDHYGSFDAIKDAFVEFIENVPFYGAAMLCLDHPEVQAIIPRIRDRRIVTYGFSAQADVRGTNVTPGPDGNRFDVVVRDRDGNSRTIEGIHLPMSGRHNVQNALAAIAVAGLFIPTGMANPALPFAILTWPAVLILALRTRFMGAAPLVWLGDRSYSIYLLNIPVAEGLLRLTTKFRHWDYGLLAAHMLFAAIVLLLAELTYRIVERPAQRIIRNRWKNRRSGLAVAAAA